MSVITAFRMSSNQPTPLRHCHRHHHRHPNRHPGLTQFAQDMKARQPKLLLCRLCDGDDGANDRGRDWLIGVRHAQQHAHQPDRLLLLELKLVIPRERPASTIAGQHCSKSTADGSSKLT